jgi:hypothetical protein
MALVVIVIDIIVIGYSVSLFLTSPSQVNAPTSLRLSQWSGYIVASNIHDFSPVVTSVSGSWTVPRVQSSKNDTFSGVWVGIGGYGEETLIQIGTEQEYVDGRSVYYAWYELLPDYLVRISNFRVRPGDIITASISLINERMSTWSMTLRDITWGGRFEKVVVYNSSMLSAEWIMERPKVNDTISTLANFGNITFTNCKATLNGVTENLGNFSYAHLVMHNEEEIPLVSVSPLIGNGSSFTVSYLESPNPTPTASSDSMIQALTSQHRDTFLQCPSSKQEHSDSTYHEYQFAIFVEEYLTQLKPTNVGQQENRASNRFLSKMFRTTDACLVPPKETLQALVQTDVR